MKKLLTTLIVTLWLSCVLTNNCFAAIAAATVWEVRTTGSSNNGGGYFSGGGTDYSQQDAAQLSLTDLANLSASTTLTSATGGFTSAMVNNTIYIASGTNFIVNYYQITAYTDTNTVTIDRTANATLDASAGVGYVGGALISLNTAVGTAAVSSNTIHVQSGTYAETVTFNSAKDDLVIIGYKTARLDSPSGTNRPYIDATGLTNGLNIVTGSSGHYIVNMRIANATADGINEVGNAYFINVKSSNNGDKGCEIAGDTAHIACEYNNNTGSGSGGEPYSGVTFYYSYGHDNAGFGLSMSKYNYECRVIGNLAEGNTSHGLYMAQTGFINSNTAYNNTGATTDGIRFGSGNGAPNKGIVCNNNSSNNGRYGIVQGNDWLLFVFLNNAYYGNGTAGLYYLNSFALSGGNVTTDTMTGVGGVVSSGSSVLNAGLDVSTLSGASVYDYKVNIGVDQDDNVAAGAGGGRGARFLIQ